MPEPNELQENPQLMKQKATEFIQEEALNNAYSQEVKQLSDEDRMLDVTKERLRKAGEQNKVIGFAIKNADELNLDASQTERLSSIKRRNLANMILNSEPVSKENPLMKEIRNKVAEVEKVILKRVSGYLSQTDDLNSPKTIQYLAMRLDDVILNIRIPLQPVLVFLTIKTKRVCLHVGQRITIWYRRHWSICFSLRTDR